MFTPIFPDNVTSQLRLGMHASQAHLILGDPHITTELKSGMTEWRYSDPIRADYCLVIDSENTVQYLYVHD